VEQVFQHRARPDSVLSQEEITRANQAFTKWSREISVGGLKQYVRERCEQGEISIHILLHPGKVFIPTPNFSLADELSYASPEQRVQQRANLQFTYREVSDFTDVLQRDPAILVAFHIMRSFIGDYIKQSTLGQECPHHAMILRSLEDHYRLAANFIQLIPISTYLASSDKERLSFTSASLNGAAAAQGLQLLRKLGMFSFRGIDAYPGKITPESDIERFFTCPAKSFLGKVFGETYALDNVVSFIHKALNKEIVPKLILDECAATDSEPAIIAVPDAMSIVKKYIGSRVELLGDCLRQQDVRGWAGLARNLIYANRVETFMSEARQGILRGSIPARHGNSHDSHPS
jgi:hypothetical protein